MEPPVVGHCFLSISCGSWKKRTTSCFVDDRAETWGECLKRIIEREVTGADLLLRSLVDIYPDSRPSVYRLRYGNGCSTIVKVQWQEGGINSRAPLENAFVETVVSVRPQNHAQVDPDKSVIGSFDAQRKRGPSTKKCTLEFRLLAIDESPLRATAEKCHIIDVAGGFGDGWTISETSSEEVSSLLDAGMRCLNFRDEAVTDDGEAEKPTAAASSSAKDKNSRKRKSEAGPIEADVPEVVQAENENEKPAAKPGSANKHSSKQHDLKPQPKKPKPEEERKRKAAAPADEKEGRKAAGGLPKGWTFIGPNTGGMGNTRYFSPLEDYEFTSRPEVKRFLEVLKETGGDEVEAAKRLKRHGTRKKGGDKKETSSEQKSKPISGKTQTPRAPLTAFNLFSKDRREGIKKANPGKSAAEISSLVGKAWKALPDGQRKPYVDDAAEKRAEHKELGKSKAIANDGKRKKDDDKKETSSEQKSKPKSRKRLKKNEDPHKPQAPLTAFNLFAKDRREGIKKANPGKSAAEISSLVGKAWKALPDGQRKPYVDDAAEKRAEYNDAIARYTSSNQE